MKKIFLISAALLALVACHKEIHETSPAENPEDVVLTFMSEKPALDSESGTKTAWDSETSSIVWSDKDMIRVAYTFNGLWMGQNGSVKDGEAKFYASKEVSIDPNNASIGTFTVPINFNDPAEKEEGEYIFYTLYPSAATSLTTINATALNISIPDTQTPESNSFDRKSDLLIGKTEKLLSTGLPTEPIGINWTRLVAHADLTFSNMAFDGEESINSITLTTNPEANLSGGISVNLVNGAVTDGSSNSLTLDGKNIKTEGNQFEVWACVLPVTFSSLTIEIKTNKAVYVREVVGIQKTFKQNARNKLTINMSTAIRTEDAPDEYSIFSDNSLVEGDYVIYYNDKVLKAAVESNRMQNGVASPEFNVIKTNDPSIIWHIAPSTTNDGYYTLYNASTKMYLAATASNNQAQLVENAENESALFSISHQDGKYDFINKKNSRYLRNNGDYGWGMYADNTGGALTLFFKDTRKKLDAPASVSASINKEDDTVIDVIFSTVTEAASYVIVATSPEGVPVEKTDVVASPATISVNDGLTYNTDYTISVYAIPSNTKDYKNSEATVAAETVTTGEAPEGYVLITSLSDVSTGKYIIAAKKEGKYYAMLNSFAAKIDGKEIGSSNFVPNESANDFFVTITKSDDDKYKIKNTSQTLGWSSNTNFTFNNTGTTDWELSQGKNGTFRFGISTRAIAFNGAQFGPYSTSNITEGSSTYFDVELFKYNGSSDIPDVGDEPSVDTEHEGTAEDPFSVADAILMARQVGAAGTEKEYYIKGKISQTPDINDQFGNATFDIMDENGETFQIFRIYSFGGEKFTGKEHLEIGDEVVALGKLKLYSDTPEMTDGKLISVNGKTSFDDGTGEGGNGGDTTDPENPGGDGGEGEGDTEPEEIELTFDLTKNPNNWPDNKSSAPTNASCDYELNGKSYTFNLTNCRCYSGYLMLTATAYLGLPAVEGYKLTKVVGTGNKGASNATSVSIVTATSNGNIIGAAQTWIDNTTPGSYIYSLSGTSEGTMYYMKAETKNCQCTKLVLTYHK